MKQKKIPLPLALFFILFSLGSCKKEASPLTDQSQDSENQSILRNMDSSLVLWLPFKNGNTSDLSGKGNHVLFNNARRATGAKGRTDQAFGFNGIGQYMVIKNSASLNPQTITLAVLAKLNGTYSGPNGISRILMKGDDDQTNGVYYLAYDQNGYMIGNYGDNQFDNCAAYTTPSFYSYDKWYRIIYTYDGVVGNLYIDGVLESSNRKTASFNPTSNWLRIGTTGRTDFPYWFHGVLDEVRIYNRALSEGEVKLVNSKMGE